MVGDFGDARSGDRELVNTVRLMTNDAVAPRGRVMQRRSTHGLFSLTLLVMFVLIGLHGSATLGLGAGGKGRAPIAVLGRRDLVQSCRPVIRELCS